MLQKDYIDPIRFILKARDDFFGSKALFKTFPDAAYKEEDLYTICFTGINESFANGVWKHCNRSLNEQEINGILDSPLVKEKPFFWWECPILYGQEENCYSTVKSPSKNEILIQKGLHFAGFLTGVWTSLETLAPKDQNMEVRKVDSKQELQQFCDCIFSCYVASHESKERFFKTSFKAMEEGKENHYLAYVEDKAVSGITLATGKETAGLWNFVTHPDYRRRGIGSALIHTVLSEAKKMGYEKVMAILFGDKLTDLWKQFHFSEVCKFPYYICE